MPFFHNPLSWSGIEERSKYPGLIREHSAENINQKQRRSCISFWAVRLRWLSGTSILFEASVRCGTMRECRVYFDSLKKMQKASGSWTIRRCEDRRGYFPIRIDSIVVKFKASCGNKIKWAHLIQILAWTSMRDTQGYFDRFFLSGWLSMMWRTL